MRNTLLNAVLIFGLTGPAQAVVIVDPDTKAHFQFDVSALGAISFDGAAYDCFSPGGTECPSGDPNRLDSLASFQLDFGSTLGDDDLGTAFIFNPFSSSADNLAAPLLVAPGNSSGTFINVSSGLSSLFVTVVFFDDVFGIGNLRLDTRNAGSIFGEPVEPVEPVVIDIKPGSNPNGVNPRSKGVIPIAVLGSVDFDATQVDFSTVEFGPGGAAPVHDGHVEDVNSDGFADMVFHFKVSDTGIACGDTDATLTGETFGGDSITGTDAVKTTGCK